MFPTHGKVFFTRKCGENASLKARDVTGEPFRDEDSLLGGDFPGSWVIKMNTESFEKIIKITGLCRNISENPLDIKLLKELRKNVKESPRSFVKAAQKPLIACFYPFIKSMSSSNGSCNNYEKQILIESLKELLDKLDIENTTIFFNFYTFLLFEIYDYTKHQVLSVSEEYKLTVLECITSLIQSVSLDIVEVLYNKENVPKFSQVIYVCGELAKKEKSRDIRCSAITCIMALAKVLNTDDIDVVLRDTVAAIFMFFLPGLSGTFAEIALEDLKVGHRVPMMAIRTYGRIVALVMQDYNPNNKADTKEILTQNQIFTRSKTKWKDKKEIDEYLDNTKRTPEWYKATDEKLNITLKQIGSLASHSHVKVRFELVCMASDIICNCITTMPVSISSITELLIILSQDDEISVSTKSRKLMNMLSSKLSTDNIKSVFECLEEGFYNAINSLPRKFNCLDDREKVSALNLLIGYIKLFGEHNLSSVLLSPTILHKLVQTLLHVSELKMSNISLLEEYTVKDLNLEADYRTPWTNFHYFKDEIVKQKIEILCAELARHDCFEIVYDSLLDTFLYEVGHKNEAVYLINAHILGLENKQLEELPTIKNILNIYTDDSYNDLQSLFDSEEHTFEQIQGNVIKICLLTEGVGKIAIMLEKKFKDFLLKSLYTILEKAGSGHPLIRAAGLSALNNIIYSCGYADVTDLINSNFEFFSYHVERKLIKLEDKEGVLNVLSVVLKYSKKDVLQPISSIIEEVLLQSCDRFKAKNSTAYLKLFKIFILNLHKWFEIKVNIEPIKSKKQKEMNQEDFKVSGISETEDFSDDIMEGKTAEELFKEDMMKEENENDEPAEEYKKHDLPVHIKLTTLILGRSLHFLPSKNQTRKLVVLEILINGLEILRDREDELLPIVHQIWSPLVQRFTKDEDPLIIRFSFNLLVSLARLSKDFIRMRTSKEVLPNIMGILKGLSNESYLKDKGSAYRYTQAYKLQVKVLEHLGSVLINLETHEKTIDDCMDCVFLYLSDRQPQTLQVAALGFFKTLITYDLELVEGKVSTWAPEKNEYETNVIRLKNILKCPE